VTLRVPWGILAVGPRARDTDAIRRASSHLGPATILRPLASGQHGLPCGCDKAAVLAEGRVARAGAQVLARGIPAQEAVSPRENSSPPLLHGRSLHRSGFRTRSDRAAPGDCGPCPRSGQAPGNRAGRTARPVRPHVSHCGTWSYTLDEKYPQNSGILTIFHVDTRSRHTYDTYKTIVVL
jgi:hypothetical protein